VESVPRIVQANWSEAPVFGDGQAATLKGSSVMFIENVGQFDEGARFQVRGGPGSAMWLAEDAIWVTLLEPDEPEPRRRGLPDFSQVRREPQPRKGVHVKLSFVGANPHPQLEPFGRLETKVSYFLGNDPNGWRPDVPVWGGVRYVDIYPGLDLEVSGPDGKLSQRLVARKEANIGMVRIRVEGSQDTLMSEGQLQLSTAVGELALPLLQAVSKDGMPLNQIDLNPTAQGEIVKAPFAEWPVSRNTTPQQRTSDLIYATFLGGVLEEVGNSIVVDADGAAYVTGWTRSSLFPTTPGAFDVTFSNGDAFVTRLSTDGDRLIFSTFLGGDDSDSIEDLAIDEDGFIYAAGITYSQNFPVSSGAFDSSYNGEGDIFVSKLSPAGDALESSTYLGGSNSEHYEAAVAIDATGAAYCAGSTSSDDFPTTEGAFDRTLDQSEALVAKLSPDGSQLLYSTFLGGHDDETAWSVAVDGSGLAYVAGTTWSHDFPTTPGAFDRTCGTDGVCNPWNGFPSPDAFIAKFNHAGTTLDFSTFIGGSQGEEIYSLTIDQFGAAYATGGTESTDFPTTAGAYDRNLDNGDAFVLKLAATGNQLEYGTFLGGSDWDNGWQIVVDEQGAAYLVGDTSSLDFPTTPDAFDSHFHGLPSDVFVAKLHPSGSQLLYGTYLGGDHWDNGYALDADANGAVYATGVTWSLDFPSTANAFQPTSNGIDAFVAKLGMGGAASVPPPIVFVHGWGGLPPWGSCEWPDPDDYFQSVDDDLSDYYHVEYAELETSPCYTPPLVDNVPRLESTIADAKAATGQDKVILIAHSMGGLVSRAYMEGPDYEGDVEALFTFGSPHQGVPIDLLAFLANGVPLAEYCGLLQPAVCDFSVHGMELFNRDHPNRAADVDYHVISGDAPFSPRTALAKVAYVLLDDGDDGAVQTASGIGLDGTLDRWTTDEVHGPGSGPRSYFIRDGGQSTSYTACLKLVLIYGTLDACGEIGTLDSRAVAAPTVSQHTPFAFGTLLSGETATRAVSLEGGPTLFASQWQTETVEFTLVEPSDQVIDPAYAASHPELVTYAADATSAVYEVLNADAGVWNMVLNAPSVPVDGSAYTIFAAVDSALRLTAGTDQAWYQPGSTATITAALSDPAANAEITATVLYADGITQELVLSPQGAGQYEGTYIVHDAPGYAEARVAAAGTTAGGTPMERGLVVAFQVSPSSATLSGTYGDFPEPRWPGSPYYKTLVVTVGINATIEGTLGLSADLQDTDGHHVAHILTLADVIPGPDTLELRFDGDEIYASEKDGPYTLTNLLLTDRRGSTLVVLEKEDVYTTGHYDHRSFGMEEVYLPLILRNH
jgi:pimeloyl-ACP methyl ester carboxylesterase